MADAPLLHERLRDESALVREYAERGLWALWSRSGEAAIDALMARGVEQMQAGQHKAAIASFSEIVKRKPDFAEGWNKRATVYFLAGDYQRSIADCDQVLAATRATSARSRGSGRSTSSSSATRRRSPGSEKRSR
ncbi:MAG TPA: tetratricopeptide repeat protein [Burkholderiales bacterium]